MSEERRCLPLTDERGSWITRPDLYVLIRMSVPADHDGPDLAQAYQYIAEGSDNTEANLNGPEGLLERHYIRGHRTERRYAAMVLTEMLRLSLNGWTPTLGKAVRLVVHFPKDEKPNTLERSLEEQVRKAFSRWRNTCHLEAAFRISTQVAGVFEGDPEKFQKFLAMAKALETFMDGVCEHGELIWNPWRVPDHIAPDFKGSITRFSAEEKRLIGTA